jgi:hypothetical protein
MDYQNLSNHVPCFSNHLFHPDPPVIRTFPNVSTTNTGSPSFRPNLLHTLYKTSGHLRLILAN